MFLLLLFLCKAIWDFFTRHIRTKRIKGKNINIPELNETREIISKWFYFNPYCDIDTLS